MAQKFLLRPRYFINNLLKEGTRMISLAHENTLFAQLKLINAMDTLHRSEHGDFNIDIIQFTQALVAKLPILSSRLRRVAFTNILEALAA